MQRVRASAAGLRVSLLLGIILSLLAIASGLTWAQNENETVGFASNHAFDSGQFGENIDILNGSLSLSTPIGQRYEVNQNLGYQLILAYTSKVWMLGTGNGTSGVIRRGPMGLGNVLNLGRIYRDVGYATRQALVVNNGVASYQTVSEYQCTWYFVTPDGNQHRLAGQHGPYSGATCVDDWPLASQFTTDGTYYSFGGFPGPWGGTGTPPVLTMGTPDGMRYTFGWLVQTYDAGGTPIQSTNSVADGTATNAYLRYNNDFGGWYLTKIEDLKSDDPDGFNYKAWVQIAYDNTLHAGTNTHPWSHIIHQITDSTTTASGRTITFINGCSKPSDIDPNASTACYTTPLGTNSSVREAARTDSIIVPAFGTGVTAQYDFVYTYAPVLDEGNKGSPIPIVGNYNELTTIKYPPFCKHADATTDCSNAQNHQRYTMSFTYTDGQGNNWGELNSRTLPTLGTVSYGWDGYDYLGGGGFGHGLQGTTRQVVSKTVDGNSKNWKYARTGSNQSNPSVVTITDPFGNDTVYYYHASTPDIQNQFHYCPEDGWTPDWNDGLNTRIEYYEGTGNNRVLKRSETREYDSDRGADQGAECSSTQRSKQNIRMSRKVTTYVDDSGRQSIVANSDWDGMGHWQVVTETGDEAPIRITRTLYAGYDPARFLMREVSDGQKVISRTDNDYSLQGLKLSIERATLPGSIGTTHALGSSAGDIVTVYTYDPAGSGNVTEKDITDHGYSGVAPNYVATSPEYQIQYSWQAGGYLASKIFVPFTWKAIDRTRDPNTGLIQSSKDPAGNQTSYTYDSLGRIYDIVPTTPEWKTQVEYRGVTSTSVRQGDPIVMGTDYSCGVAAGDYIMSCYDYDDLGRLIKTTKRAFDPTASTHNPYQTRGYDQANRLLSQSEWVWSNDTRGCAGTPMPAGCGTTYDYQDSNPSSSLTDPFGRVRTVTTADNQVTKTDYVGLRSTMTVQGIQEPAGLTSAATTYYRDGWGRLIYVQAPPGHCSVTTTTYCTSDSMCNTGESCVGGGADAIYSYDIRNNLIEADLVEHTNLRKQSRFFEYDALNRLRYSWNPEDGASEVTGYDPLGNVTKGVDASGATFLSTYDTAGRLTLKQRQDYLQTPKIAVTCNIYDQATGSCPSTAATSCTSGCGRLLTAQDFDDAGNNILTRTFAYTGLNGRISSQSNFFSDWGGGTATLSYTSYNNFGLLTGLTYPDGPAQKGGAFNVTYNYTSGYPVWVAHPDLPYETFGQVHAYNAAGGVQDIATYDREKTLIQPDTRNRPSQITIGLFDFTNNVFTRWDYASGAYAYDGAGNISQIGASTYAYDAADRLVKAAEAYSGSSWPQTFSYDDYGNMITKALTESNTLTSDNYTVTDQGTHLNINQILSHNVCTQQVSPPTTPSCTSQNLIWYDARGNLTEGDAQWYEFDSRNRIKATRSWQYFTDGVPIKRTQPLASYAYDSASDRIRKDDVARGLTTYYFRDGQGRLISEFRRTLNGSYVPEWSKHYMYLGDRLVAMRENRVPSPVAGLKATTSTSGPGKVILSWTANPASENVTCYNVYGALNQSPPSWMLLTPTPPTNCLTQTTFTDSSPTSGVWVEYSVTAWSSAGGEGYGTNPLVLDVNTPITPTIPTGLGATPGDSRVDLTWKANPVTDYVAGYYVYRSDGGPSSMKLRTPVPITATSFADLDVTNGTTYWYAIVAVGSVSATGSSAPVSAMCASVQATPSDRTPPAAPTGVKAQPSCTAALTITVSWNPSLGADQNTTYTLTRAPDFYAAAGPKTGLTGTSYTDTDVHADQAYQYTLHAVDGSTNASQESVPAWATPRAQSGTIAPPGTPSVKSLDGEVSLRFWWPTTGFTVPPYARIYRKPNSQLSCSSYLLLDQISTTNIGLGGPLNYVDYVDGAAPNDIAYDYAITYVDASGKESLPSVAGLGTPVGRPLGYSECVESLNTSNASYWEDGAKLCPISTLIDPSGTSFRRLNLRWQKSQGRPYLPMTASNAGGSPGYLKGYHLYAWEVDDFIGVPQIGQADATQLIPLTTDYEKWYCHDHPSIACYPSGTPNTCPTGDTCVQRTFHPSGGLGYWPPRGVCTGLLNTTTCVTNTDCNSGALCEGTCQYDPNQLASTLAGCWSDSDCSRNSNTCHFVSDADLTLYRDDGASLFLDRTSTDANYWGNPVPYCFAAKAVHKVYANNTWLSVESGFSDNLSLGPSQLTVPGSRCNASWDACSNVGVGHACEDQASSPPAPPQVLSAPSASVDATGAITVTWSPPSDGLCQFVSGWNLPFPCSYPCKQGDTGCCPQGPPTLVCEPCQPEEPCYNSTMTPVGGKCVLPGPVITCPSPQVPPVQGTCSSVDDICVARPFAGYYLYASESNTVNSVRVMNPSYLLRPSPFITLDKNTTSYKFTTPSGNDIGFQVATFDSGGRVSELSPPSAWLATNGGALLAPSGLETSIWLPNLSQQDTNAYTPIPLSWTYFGGGTIQGFRVWRSTDPAGPFCAIVKSSPGVAGVTPCPIVHNSPYSNIVTTKSMGFGDVDIASDTTYYYKVTAVNNSGQDSPFSTMVAEEEPQLATLLLIAPPASFQALAPRHVANGSTNLDKGIQLRWCQNPVEDGVIQYNVYRSQQSGGPYTLLAQISATYFAQNWRVEITDPNTSPSVTQGCTPGIPELGGTCGVFDLTVAQPPLGGTHDLPNEVANYVYYYVVTAVRPKTGGTVESGYSAENAGWPSYDAGSGNYSPRFDPDNAPITPCGIETASLMGDSQSSGASVDTDLPNSGLDAGLAEAAVAPYRSVGQTVSSASPQPNGAKGGGTGGGPSGNPAPGPPQPVAQPTYVYYHLDHLATPRVITGGGLALPDLHHYMPFGEEKGTGAQATANTRQFTGHERDAESGMDYMMARYYASSLARFMSSESGDDIVLETPQSWNKYVYVRNNPLIGIDPDGKAVYLVNRDFDFEAPEGAAVPRDADGAVSHTFVVETDVHGEVIHTYSWTGKTDQNDPNVQGKWHEDQPIDLHAAKQALDQGMAQWVGDNTLNPFLDQAFKEHYNNANDPSNHHNYLITLSCKTEAHKLVREAKRKQKEEKKKEKKEAKANAPKPKSPHDPQRDFMGQRYQE